MPGLNTTQWDVEAFGSSPEEVEKAMIKQTPAIERIFSFAARVTFLDNLNDRQTGIDICPD